MYESIYKIKNIKKYNSLFENSEAELHKISQELGIAEKEIYIHSTHISGIQDLLGSNTGEYLSVSSLSGSSKFIEKGYKTIYTILQVKPEHVDFKSWGDVGWKGGNPKKTSYDEIGVIDWKLVGLYIPEYYKTNKNLIARTLLAQDTALLLTNDDLYLEIIGADFNIIKEVRNILDERFNSSMMYSQGKEGFYRYIEDMENEFKS